MNNKDQTQADKMLIAATVPETVQLLMRGQIEWFADHGYTVEVCTDRGRETGLSDNKFVAAIDVKHTIAMARDFSIAQDFKSLIRWVALLRSSKPKYLVACTPKASLLSLIAGFLTRVPNRVYILFGLRYETATGIARLILKLTEKICGACSHIVIVVSPSLAKCAVQEGLIPQRKIRQIGMGSSNGVDSERFQPMPDEMRAKRREVLGFSRGDFVVGFIGRLTPDKGIETLISAFAKITVTHPQIKLLLIGPDEGSRVTQPWAKSVGPQLDTSQWHPIVDVLALPTKREGFPNVVLEAHACEVPVVTTRATGAIDSVVHNENGILIDIDDAEQLGNALIALYEDQNWAKQMGKNGRAWVIENFQPESIWLGMDQIFQTMNKPS